MKYSLYQDKLFWLFIAVAVFLTVGLFFNYNIFIYYLVVLSLLILLVVFYRWPVVGIYLIALLFPFNYLEVVYGNFNVPYVDLIALLLFISWLIRSVNLLLKNKSQLSLKKWPGWPLMLLFVAACFLSLLNVDREIFNDSLKYIFRPVIFFYLMYVVMPISIIDNFKKLLTTFKIMFIVGIGISLMGIWSLIFPPLIASSGFRRALPLSIFGISPLGINHNSLAEILVLIVPLAILLFWQEKDIVLKNIYLFGAFLMATVNLLTLSRSGWLALAVEILVLVIFKYKKEVRHIVSSSVFYLLLFIITPLIYIMYIFINSQIVSSSNISRLKLLDIAFTLFKEHPLTGSGIGTFITTLSGIQWFLIEYGSVLDAHSFLLSTLAETGLLGVLSFCGLLTYIVYILFRGYQRSKKQPGLNNLLLIGLVVTLGGIVFQLFSTSYYLARFWFPVGLALTALQLAQTKFLTKKHEAD